MATDTTAGRGQRRSRRSARSARSTLAPSGSLAATTAQPSTTRTDGSARRRSRNSSWHPSASSPANFRRPPTEARLRRACDHLTDTMTIDADPYRTLGLSRGASIEEIKGAYRRLAKIHHPDAAGEKNVPRFLAIQAAYEQLAGGADGRSSAGQAGSRNAWEADTDRSNATRRAYGG